MIKDFVYTYAKMIVTYPDEVSVDIKELDKDFYEVTIKTNENDVGKLIGKSGNMINAIKTIINGCKAKDGKSYKVQVISNLK